MGIRKIANGYSFEMLFTGIYSDIIKYDYPMTAFRVNSDIVLNYDSKTKEFLIRYKGNEYAKFNPLLSTGKLLTNAFVTGLTLGIAGDTSLIFLTTDKSVRDAKTLGYIRKSIKESLPRLEQNMKDYSKDKWHK